MQIRIIGRDGSVNSLRSSLQYELHLTVDSAMAEKSRLKVDFVHWHAVGSWRWLTNDDSCGICRMPFDACCAGCVLPGDDCPIVWGQCSHCFHLHCITKWLNTKPSQEQCPMCRQDWEPRFD